MGELGFLGAPIPEAYGGSGMDYVSFAILCEELERADTRLPGGPERPRRPQLADAPAVGDRGAAAALPRAPGARREARHVRPDRAGRGHRRGQPRDDRPARRRLVRPQRQQDLDQPGRPRRPLPGLRHASTARRGTAASPRSSSSAACPASPPARSTASSGSGPATPGSLNFDGVRVPASNRVGEEGEGFLIAMSAIDQGRYTVAAGAVGLAQACLDASVKYAHERQTFGAGDRPAPAGQADDRQDGPGHRGRPAAVLAGGLAQEPRPAQHARDEPGQVVLHRARRPGRPRRDPGPRRQRLLDEFPVERYLRNAKAAVIYEGTSQLHTLIQADYALGYREDRPLRCRSRPAPGFEPA